MILVAEQCIAMFFVNRMLKKLMTETVKGEQGRYDATTLDALQIFTEPNLHRQKRAGLYAWLDLEEDELAISIDWPLDKGLCHVEFIRGYAIIYAKSLVADPSNYIEVTAKQMEHAVDG